MSSEQNKSAYKNEKVDCTFWFFSPLRFTRSCKSKKCPLAEIHPSDVECRYRPFLSIGLWLIQLLKRILIPVSSVCGVGVVHAMAADAKLPNEKCDPTRKLVRACDLTVYAEEKKCVECVPAGAAPEKDTIFTETIKCVRKEIWFFMDQAKVARRQMEHCLHDVKEQSKETLEFLREESNFAPRMGAIAVGGLAGYILALRKGFFRKLLYTSAGAGSMAALTYPNEAREISQEGIKIIKRYIIIGYHLINGVSRDLTGYQLPPLPNGHLVISDDSHSGPEAVPTSAHILPPTATPTHIPLPHEDPHEITKNHHHHQRSEKE